MKTKTILFIVTVISLFFPNINFAQRPDLGSATNLVLFTTVGALGNTGTSQVIGNMGTNTGAISGFDAPTTVAGNIDSGNAVTSQYALDVQAAYDNLFGRAPTNSSHAPAFGSGETLFPGVYSIGAAGSAAGLLTLDAQGNSNAIFIFKFGGAFTTGASTTISLINGAAACNIFWIANGAISMAASTDMKGTLIASNGAVSMATGGTLEGRMFSTTGSATIYVSSIAVPTCSILPIGLLSFTGICNKQNIVLNWSTGTEINNKHFTVERSEAGINWEVVGTVTGAVNSNSPHTYTLTDKLPYKGTSFYRLKQTDLDGNYKYGTTVAVRKCEDGEKLSIYPNPSNGKFELLFTGDTHLVNSIEIFNTQGQRLYDSPGFKSTFDLSNRTPGVYFMHVHMNSKNLILKIVIKK